MRVEHIFEVKIEEMSKIVQYLSQVYILGFLVVCFHLN